MTDTPIGMETPPQFTPPPPEAAPGANAPMLAYSALEQAVTYQAMAQTFQADGALAYWMGYTQLFLFTLIDIDGWLSLANVSNAPRGHIMLAVSIVLGVALMLEGAWVSRAMSATMLFIIGATYFFEAIYTLRIHVIISCCFLFIGMLMLAQGEKYRKVKRTRPPADLCAEALQLLKYLSIERRDAPDFLQFKAGWHIWRGVLREDVIQLIEWESFPYLRAEKRVCFLAPDELNIDVQWNNVKYGWYTGTVTFRDVVLSCRFRPGYYERYLNWQRQHAPAPWATPLPAAADD